MAHAPNPYRGFRYPVEVIQHAVWLYHCFSLSLRDVETILAARGIVVSYESIREWGLRFGRQFANELKRRRPRPGDKWHMDGVSRTRFPDWRRGAVGEMRVGPSAPAVRCRRQTTASCCRQKRWW
jgi:putative transposase